MVRPLETIFFCAVVRYKPDISSTRTCAHTHIPIGLHTTVAFLFDQSLIAIAYHSPLTSAWHMWLGFGEWLWKSIVGLRPTAPAFANVSVAPLVGFADGPASVSSRLKTARGVVMVAWNMSLARDRVQLTVSLPVGVQHAVVTIPAPFLGNGTRAAPQECMVSESGRVLWKRVAASSDTWPKGILSVHTPGLGNATVRASASVDAVQVVVVGNGQFDFETSLLS